MISDFLFPGGRLQAPEWLPTITGEPVGRWILQLRPYRRLKVKVKIKIKFNSRIKRLNLIQLSLKASLNSSFSQRIVGYQGRVLFALQLSRSNNEPTTPITTLIFMRAPAPSQGYHDTLFRYRKAWVWLSPSMKEVSVLYSKHDCRRGKLFISSTRQWLTVSLSIGDTPYRTHLPSDSFIYVYTRQSIV